MSERTEVEVLFPLNRQPDKLEQRLIIRAAFDKAKELVAPGRVLGLVGVTGAVHTETGSPALKIRFAVEAPEAIQPQRKVHATH